MSRYVAGGAGGFNLLRHWRKKLSTKAKEASPKASLFYSISRSINLATSRGFTRAYFSPCKRVMTRPSGSFSRVYWPSTR
jgi:hypothetical protein